MGIGQLRCSVVDVDDLEIAEAFWSEVTGMPVIPSVFPGRYSYLGDPDPWRHRMILHLVKTRKGPEANRAHVDIWVRDVDAAITQIEVIGGSLKRPPTLYPRPGSFAGDKPLIDWAVVRDPFGNEFCLVSPLSEQEAAAVLRAYTESEGGAEGDDERWRAAAGRLSHSEREALP